MFSVFEDKLISSKTFDKGDGNMQKNVGNLDAYMRITGGLFMIGTGIMRSSKTMIGLGAMKVAEGITRFCPMLYLLNLSTVDLDEKICKAINRARTYQSPPLEEYMAEQ